MNHPYPLDHRPSNATARPHQYFARLWTCLILVYFTIAVLLCYCVVASVVFIRGASENVERYRGILSESEKRFELLVKRDLLLDRHAYKLFDIQERAGSGTVEGPQFPNPFFDEVRTRTQPRRPDYIFRSLGTGNKRMKEGL